MAAAAGTAIVCFAGVGALLLWATGLRIRTFLPSISFPNAGNLGLPPSLYAFGPEGLGYAIAYAFNNFETLRMYAIVLLILAASILLNAALRGIEARSLRRRGM